MNAADSNQPERSSRGAKTTAFFKRVWDFLSGPHPSIVEVGHQRQARLLAGISLVLFVGTMGNLAMKMDTDANIIFPVILVVFSIIIYGFSRTHALVISSSSFCIGLAIAPFLNAVLNPDSNSILSLFLFITLSMLAASALLSTMGLIVVGAIGLGMAYSINFYTTIAIEQYWPISGSITLLVVLFITTHVYRYGIERVRMKQMQDVNRELENYRASLEQRVEERTQEVLERTRQVEDASHRMEKRAAQFRAITEVTRAAASVRELGTLLPTITQVIARQFGFYHVGIFFVDEDKEFAVLQAANSEGGQRMLERGHQLRVGETGIVGFVASRGVPRIVLDVGEDAVFFNNPDLPGTRSEMALPLKSSGKTIGVLDVQSELPSAFSQEDITALSTLADQVGIAIDNARLFESTQKALADAQAYYQQFIRMEWRSLSTEERTLGFRSGEKQVEALAEPVRGPEIDAALSSGKTSRSDASTATGTREVAIPVKLRDEVIGVLNIRAKSQKTGLRDDDIVMAETVADQVALALENARLLGRAQKRAAKERTIGDISSRLSTSISLDNILQTTVEELGRILPGSEVIIQLQSDENSNGAGK